MIALLRLLFVGPALAQTYAFPSAVDHDLFYPTAYFDHGGNTDWDCGSITYGGHRGSDFGGGGFEGMDAGREITAAAPGTVVFTNDGEFDRCTTGDCAGGGGFGNYVQIAHPDGRNTFYAHLKSGTVAVAAGDAVACGDRLGEMGSSGYSTGPHVHFEVRDAGNVAFDPFEGPCGSASSTWVDQGIHGELPGEICEDAPECAPERPLACGETVSGRNDDPGSVHATTRYGCVDFVYSGPERSFTLTVDHDQPVTLALHGLAADLDLFVLDGVACDGTGCVTASSNPYGGDEAVAFDAVAGVAYVVVVDGWEGAVSDFDLDVGCVELPDPPDTGTGPAPTEDTGHTALPVGDTGDPVATPPAKEPLDEPGGCACAASDPRAGVLGVAAAALLARRRRRA